MANLAIAGSEALSEFEKARSSSSAGYDTALLLRPKWVFHVAEFWANRGSPSLEDAEDLECWQFDYNWRRPHGSLNGKAPIERIAELRNDIPDREDVALGFDVNAELLRLSNSAVDIA
jgi:transposase InsO family protein